MIKCRLCPLFVQQGEIIGHQLTQKRGMDGISDFIYLIDREKQWGRAGQKNRIEGG